MSVNCLYNVVPAAQVAAVVKRLYLDIRDRGVSKEELDAWQQVACPFPHLRFEPEVDAVRDSLLWSLGLTADDLGTPCEPQFIWHLPNHESGPKPEHLHLDEEPPWADGRRYTWIAGVALSEWSKANGALLVKEDDGSCRPVEMMAGDVVLMSPDTLHMSGWNQRSHPRIGLYYRWVK